MKIAKECGRIRRLVGIGLAVLTVAGARPSSAQQQQQDGAPPPIQVPPRGKKVVNLRDAFQDVQGVKPVVLPVNPSDPIAVINNQVITRQQLADECVAKEGKKVLDTMIHRVLVEQALARQKMTVTAAEIDEEIDSVAARFGISRDIWLRTLDKEKGISPAQYAREIIYPTISLRKLCKELVTVTPKDLQEAFEAQFGQKLRVRMILVNNQQKAIDIWDRLHDNPGGFEAMAKEVSMDPGSKSLGGLLGEPITRHAYPRTVSDAAFRQLVDGDPKDRDPSHKPKDGDVSGPIQMDQSAWILLRREELIPPRTDINLSDLRIKQQVYDMIYQVKLNEAMEKFFEDLIKKAAIENRLTGGVKMANEEVNPDYRVDGDVKLMGRKPGDDATATRANNAPAGDAAAAGNMQRPAALSPDAAKQFRPLRPVQGAPAQQAGTSSTAPQPAGGNQ